MKHSPQVGGDLYGRHALDPALLVCSLCGQPITRVNFALESHARAHEKRGESHRLIAPIRLMRGPRPQESLV